MGVAYLYCDCCGYEDFDIYVEYVRTCANGDICACPNCGEETQGFEKDEELS